MTARSSRRAFVRIAGSMLATSWMSTLPFAARAELPAGDIRLVVPLTPGSSVDVVGRVLMPKMSASLGHSMFADNRPGADGIIATQFVRNAKPDGQTILICTPAHAINRYLYPKQATYDPVRDFTLIGLAATNVNVLMVPIDSDIRSVADLIRKAKAKPATLNYGDSGGTAGGSAELFNLMADISTNNILYRGANEALTDILGGRLDFIFSAMSSGLPLIRGGKIRALAVTGPKRHPSLPDLPPINETLPGFEVLGWYGLVGPKGLAPATVDLYNKALAAGIDTSDVRNVLGTTGFDPAAPNTPAQFEQFVTAELAKWGRVIKPLG